MTAKIKAEATLSDMALTALVGGMRFAER